MVNKNRKLRKFREYSSGGRFKNDQLSRELNKFIGLPEDFQGNIKDIEKKLLTKQRLKLK